MPSPEEELGELEARHLRRELRRIDSPQGTRITREGRSFLNFSSNDYLGLAGDPRIKAALIAGVERHGAGSGASRLICGTLAPHAELESALAAMKGTEAALTFSSGYAAAGGVLTALLGKGDVVILDKLCHASLIDGARASGAALRVFPHNDIGKLAAHLAWAGRQSGGPRRVLVVTESVFSMDGDRAPLAEIVALKEKHGAWLLVDEAHAFGIIGPGGRGLAAELGIEAARVDLHLGTLSKAAGLSGGYLCARRAIVDLLVNRARSFIYSTAPSPAVAAAAVVAVRLIADEEEGGALRVRLWNSVRQLTRRLGQRADSAIIPVILGSNEAALDAAERFAESGYLIPAIRYPTVPRGSARLRVTLSAGHEERDVAALGDLLVSLRACGGSGEPV